MLGAILLLGWQSVALPGLQPTAAIVQFKPGSVEISSGLDRLEGFIRVDRGAWRDVPHTVLICAGVENASSRGRAMAISRVRQITDRLHKAGVRDIRAEGQCDRWEGEPVVGVMIIPPSTGTP